MRKHSFRHHLRLSRETLRNLERPDLLAAAAGATTICVTADPTICAEMSGCARCPTIRCP
jgi:hypothetical protein